MKQLLREVFLPLDLALRDFRHIGNCIRNEKLHGVDDMLWGRGKTALGKSCRAPQDCHHGSVSGQDRYRSRSASKQQHVTNDLSAFIQPVFLCNVERAVS